MTTNKQITAVVFSYRGEEEIIAMTLPRLHAAFPTARIHVFDDANDPLPAGVVTELKYTANCQYHQTGFDRRHNLNGKPCILGELECMKQAMDEDGNTNGYLLKTDPDTVFLNADLIIDAIEKGAKWIGHSSVTGLFAGMCYLMHRSILEKAAKNAAAMEIDKYSAEDATIGALLYMAASREAYSYTYLDVPGATQAFAAFNVATIDTPEYIPTLLLSANIGHVLTFGNATVDGLSKSWVTKTIHDLLQVFYHLEEYRDQLKEQGKPFPGDDVQRLQALPLRPAKNIEEDVNGDMVVRPGGNYILRGLITSPVTKEQYEASKKQRQAEERYRQAAAAMNAQQQAPATQPTQVTTEPETTVANVEVCQDNDSSNK